MNKDWTGDTNSIFKTLGSSHHTESDREENDFYATEPRAAEWLTKIESLQHFIWEPACGEGHLSKLLEEKGHTVMSTDLIDRGYGTGKVYFLGTKNDLIIDGDIVTNPPYKFASEFIVKSLSCVKDGAKVCMFLKITFLEGKGRKDLFRMFPPKTVWISFINCAKNGDFKEMRISGGSAVAYAWYIWEKGYKGPTELKWFN